MSTKKILSNKSLFQEARAMRKELRAEIQNQVNNKTAGSASLVKATPASSSSHHVKKDR